MTDFTRIARACGANEQENKCARKMFEELGYKIVNDEENILRYEKFCPFDLEDGDTFRIEFYKRFESVGSVFNENYFTFDMSELKAINKQIEELGWSD